MTTHRLSAGSTGSPPPRAALQDHSLSWTDDLPVCHLSGVGFSTNQIYREDGFRREEHEFEDRSIHFRVENDVFLYGVFDGHEGSRVSHFAAQRMPAELLLGQLQHKAEDEDIKDILHQAFISVEKGFFESLDDALAEKAKLMLNVPEGVEPYELYNKYPDLYNKLKDIDSQISGGTTAVVALIYNNKLYIANVGCSRALLCTTDGGVLRVSQMSVDHILHNEEEVQRLHEMGVNTEALLAAGKIGSTVYTRTIGDYNTKATYREHEAMSSSSSDPVIAEPEVLGGREIDSSCSFLILMSYGLYKSLEDATGSEHVNREIASMVAQELGVQSTLNGVAQAVVDKIVRIHHDTYMTSTGARKELCQKRKDITLLVRNFNYPLPNAIGSPTSGGIVDPLDVANQNQTLNMDMTPLSITIPSSSMKSPPPVNRPFFFPSGTNTKTNTFSLTNTGSGTYTSTYTNTTSTTDSTQSGDGNRLFQRKARVGSPLKLNEDGRIEAYIDFSEFYQAMDNMSDSEKEAFNAEAELKPAYEPIAEEKEWSLDMDGEDEADGDDKEAEAVDMEAAQQEAQTENQPLQSPDISSTSDA